MWQAVHKYKAWFHDVEITLGGLYASLLPEHAKLSGADRIHEGLVSEAEDILPDYSLVPEWKSSIIFASRGCRNNCIYCDVPRLEGRINAERASIKKYIWPGHTKLIFFDNNILAMKYWREIFKEVIELGMDVDFNQGLDARLFSEEVATLISKMKMRYVRLAYDVNSEKEAVERSISLLNRVGVQGRRVLVYTLYNFTETPDEFLSKVEDILGWGAACYPMRYQPLNTLKKDSYISTKWTANRLEMVAKARRVIGYGGAFPPYEGLIKKFRNATDFDEAFDLYPKVGSKGEDKFELLRTSTMKLT